VLQDALTLPFSTLAFVWPQWLVSASINLFLVICLLMIAVILLQRPQGGGLAGAFGGGQGAGQTAFGTKTGDALTWFTVGVFALFIVMAVLLNYASRPSVAEVDAAPEAGATSAPVSTPAPAGTGPAAPAATPGTVPATPADTTIPPASTPPASSPTTSPSGQPGTTPAPVNPVPANPAAPVPPAPGTQPPAQNK